MEIAIPSKTTQQAMATMQAPRVLTDLVERASCEPAVEALAAGNAPLALDRFADTADGCALDIPKNFAHASEKVIPGSPWFRGNAASEEMRAEQARFAEAAKDGSLDEDALYRAMARASARLAGMTAEIAELPPELVPLEYENASRHLLDLQYIANGSS